MRSISYNPLWKKLIDLKMSKAELAEKAGISRSTLAKMRKDEAVNKGGPIARPRFDFGGAGSS